jgi:hypothetical protein
MNSKKLLQSLIEINNTHTKYIQQISTRQKENLELTKRLHEMTSKIF